MADDGDGVKNVRAILSIFFWSGEAEVQGRFFEAAYLFLWLKQGWLSVELKLLEIGIISLVIVEPKYLLRVGVLLTQFFLIVLLRLKGTVDQRQHFIDLCIALQLSSRAKEHWPECGRKFGFD